MTTGTILDEVLETVLLVTLALDPPILEWLCVAIAYAMRVASKPAVKRTFGALLVLVFFLLAVISIPTTRPSRPSPMTSSVSQPLHRPRPSRQPTTTSYTKPKTAY